MTGTAHLLDRLRTGSAVLLLVGAGALAVSFAADTGLSRDLLIVVAGALVVIVAALHVASRILSWRARRKLRIVMAFLEHDSAPGFCTDAGGSIFAQNRSALDRFGAQDGATMGRALEPLFANPDAVIHRLRAAASGTQSAREDVVTRRGHVRVAVHRIPGGFLWRLEDLVDRPPRAADGIGLPILTFGPSGTILYMNEVLRGLVGRRIKRLRDLFEDVPLQSGGINRLLAKAGAQTVRVVLSEPVNGRQEVFVLPAGAQGGDGQVDLDALPVALLRLDTEGQVVFANRLARELLPASARGGEARLAAMVEGLGRSVREWVSEASAGRGLYRPEVVRIAGGENDSFLQITLGRPLGDGQSGLIAVLNDATELKTMEAQFVQSQKMQAIGQLAGGVAHDFNNLLTAISGHCDLMLLRHSEGDEDHDDLVQITQNANRAAALVGQLLAFSRKQTLEMKAIDVRDALGDLTHLLNRLVGERVRLRLVHDPAVIPIRADRRQLEQVMMNLVVNARDAMPDGGEILVETQCRFLDEPLRRDRVTVPPGQYVVITVTDEGVGIPSDKLARIFEPFYTTKRPGEGTGLGLSMAYGIVKQSGGFIFADSTPGAGTRFSLFFTTAKEVDETGDAGVPPRSELTMLDALAAGVAPLVAPTEADGDAPAAPVRGDATIEEMLTAMSDGVQRDARGSRPSAGVPPSEEPGGPDVGVRTPNARAAGADGAALEARPSGAQEGTGEAVPAARGAEEDASKEPMGDRPSGDDGSVAGAVADAGDAGKMGSASPVPREGPVGTAGAMSPSDGASDGSPGAAGPVADGSGVDAATRQRTVLLVEDEAPVRAFASRALRLRGYAVVEADSAEAALEHLADGTLRVDLFVTDVMMPGLDGPTWVRQALRDRPDVRTIFISGYTQDALSETSIPVPNAVFLPKPFSLSDLTRTVEKALQ